MDINYQHHCFVCGEKNPAGLKLKFNQSEEKVWTIFLPTDTYQGYPGILHGGITSTILDEVMSQRLHTQGLAGLTARLEVRYRQSIPLYKPVAFEARIVKRKGSLVDLEAKAILEDGQVAAEALGRFMLIGNKGGNRMITRNEAVQALKENLHNQNLLNHSYAVEAIMRGLAAHYGEDEELWGLTGLLHDIDYEDTKDDPARHSLVGGEMLEKMGLPADLVQAVKCHNEYHGLVRKTLLDKALYAADPLSGLIVAGALIRPEKKLEVVEVASLLKRFGEKSFARGANREQIASCSELNLSLEEFLKIGLSAMKSNHEELGL